MDHRKERMPNGCKKCIRCLGTQLGLPARGGLDRHTDRWRRPTSCSSGNPLDLNNLPEDHNSNTTTSITSTPTNNNGRRSNRARDHIIHRNNDAAGDGDEEEEEVGKVYECRFCSLKFCKSQALGGHMNRHRQERETETLNRARQLVLNNDGAHLLGYQYPPAAPTYHSGGGIMGRDPLFRPPPPPPLNYQPTNRLFTSGGGGGGGASSSPGGGGGSPAGHHHPVSYLYASPPQTVHQLPPYPPSNHLYSNKDYYIGHVLNPAAAPPHHANNGTSSGYTCIGAPVSTSTGGVMGSTHHRVGSDGSGGGGSDGGSLASNNSSGSNHHHQRAEDEFGTGFNWGRSYAA